MSDFSLIECYELNTTIKVSSWFNNLPECLIEFKMLRKIQRNRISVRLRTKIFTHSSFVNSTRPPDFWERCERVCTWVSRAGLMRSRGVYTSFHGDNFSFAILFTFQSEQDGKIQGTKSPVRRLLRSSRSIHFVPCEQRPFDLPRLGRSKGLCSQGIHFGDVSETKSRSDHVTRNASAARNNEAYWLG